MLHSGVGQAYDMCPRGDFLGGWFHRMEQPRDLDTVWNTILIWRCEEPHFSNSYTSSLHKYKFQVRQVSSLEEVIVVAYTEIWTLTTKMENKLSATQHNMRRNVLNITYKDWKTNKWVRDQTKLMDIMEIIKNGKWTWAGHISRRTDTRWSAALTVWTPIGGKRNR